MIDIRDDLLKIVKGILAEHVPECEVRAFGSRINWTARSTSDLDLVVVGKEKINWKKMAGLKAAFEESKIPFRVDVLDWNAIPENFRENIGKKFEVVQRAETKELPLNVVREETISYEHSLWAAKPLGEVFSINPSRRIEKGSESAYIAMDQLSTGNRTISRIERRVFSGSGSKFKNGDTLLARITPCLENGKTVFVNCLEKEEVAHGSTEFIVLSGKDKLSDDLFVYYFARSPEFRAYAISQMEGSSGRQRVPAITLEKYQVNLPPLDTQRAIAHILATLDDKIELNRRMNKTLEEIARAIYKSWFVDFDPVKKKADGKPTGLPEEIEKLFPKEFGKSELGEIPKGWKVGTIGNEVQVVGGSTPSTKEPEYWENGEFSWATPKDLSSISGWILLQTERKITSSGLKKISSGLLPEGTVLLSSRAPIGYTALANLPLAINQGFIAMVCDKTLPKEFIFLWTLSNLDVIKGRANGTTFLEVSKSNFRPLPIIVPSEKIISIFSIQMKPIIEIMVNNEISINFNENIRNTLLPRLLSGSLPIRDAEKLLKEANI